MVFVHARKDTVKTAQMLREKAQEEGLVDLLDPREHPGFAGWQRDLGGSRNREMKELAALGFGSVSAKHWSQKNVLTRFLALGHPAESTTLVCFDRIATSPSACLSKTSPRCASPSPSSNGGKLTAPSPVRSCAARLPSHGESTCLPTPSSSRERRSTMPARDPSSTSAFWTCCRSSVELVSVAFATRARL